MGKDYGLVECSEGERFQFSDKPFRRGISVSDTGEDKSGDGLRRDQFSVGLGTQLLAGHAYFNVKCVIGV